MTDIERSSNEIYTMLRKAAMGCGYDHGSASDIAQAAVWLCENGMDGVGAFVAACNSGPIRMCQPEIKPQEAMFENCIVSIDAHSVFDLLLADAGIASVYATNIDVPDLLIGFAGLCARVHGVELVLAVEGGDKFAVAADLLPGQHALQSGCSVALSISGRQPQQATLSPISPLVITPANWAFCLERASRTYVPATEESRAKGAGASLTDND